MMEGKFKGEQTRNRGREKAEAMEPWASLREETRARLKTLGFRRFDESEVPRARAARLRRYPIRPGSAGQV